jgi:hypothetical protein
VIDRGEVNGTPIVTPKPAEDSHFARSRPDASADFRVTTAHGDLAMGLIKEFKDFAMRGNVVDLAVGVVIGARL